MSTPHRYFVGPHVSAAGGVANAPRNAHALAATGFALFVKNQRQWSAPPLTAAEVSAFAAQMKACGYTTEQVLPHAGYLINLANPDDTAHAKSLASFLDEIARCIALGLDKLNVHPGSHLRLITPEAACERTAAALNNVLRQTDGITLVVENTAGSGGLLGARFEELRIIRDAVDTPSRLGFCFDTAHAFAAGYDIRTRDGFLRTMDTFDEIVGLRFLRALHLNDSRAVFESRVDRHAPLEDGELGLEVFKCILRDERFQNMPLILETPDDSRWAEEVQMLLSFC